MIVENSITEEEFPIEISQMNSSFVESGQLKERIQEHYDKLSPFYNDLWVNYLKINLFLVLRDNTFITDIG